MSPVGGEERSRGGAAGGPGGRDRRVGPRPRSGYVRGSGTERALAELATRLAINLFSCVNTAAQHAAVAALTGPQEHVERMVASFAGRRDAIVAALAGLPGIRCARPGGAFYAFPDVSGTGFTARTLQDRWLEELGVATIAGTSFGARGEGHVRFSYASSLADIHEAMRRLGGWLHDHVA